MKPTYEELEAIVKKLKIDADCYKKGMEASNARLVQLAAENAALKSKAAELVHEASEVYSAYNSSITEHDGDFMDMQTLQEMQCVETPATSVFWMKCGLRVPTSAFVSWLSRMLLMISVMRLMSARWWRTSFARGTCCC